MVVTCLSIYVERPLGKLFSHPRFPLMVVIRMPNGSLIWFGNIRNCQMNNVFDIKPSGRNPGGFFLCRGFICAILDWVIFFF